MKSDGNLKTRFQQQCLKDGNSILIDNGALFKSETRLKTKFH
jgi:hypothetical protein